MRIVLLDSRVLTFVHLKLGVSDPRKVKAHEGAFGDRLVGRMSGVGSRK